MSDYKIIGCIGLMTSGKTTFSKYLESEINSISGSGICEIMSLAAPLKQFALQLGWDGNKDEKGRRLLQLLGTEVGRQCISDNLWIDKWEVMAKFRPNIKVWIIDDVRFRNEWNYVYDNDGILFKIIRKESEDLLNESIKNNTLHSSESELLSLDKDFICIENFGSMEDLKHIANFHANKILESMKNEKVV